MNETATATKAPAIISEFRAQTTKMEEQFRAALPPHIPVQRFVRVVMTAVQREPKLLTCERQSLWNACLQCASDGLLPDGREAALVPFSSDDEDKVRSGSKVTYIPMVYGLRKKVRNAGVLTDWNVQVVQEGDQFEYELGDNPFIRHKPAPTGGRTRPVLFAYSIATYPDGTKSREVMNGDQIRDIQKKSRAKKGPWADPIFFPEMARKTVARLHAKQLPMSTDLDRVLHRDDALYDFEQARDRERQAARPNTVAAALDYFGAGGGGEPPPGGEPTAKGRGSRGPTPEPEATGGSPEDTSGGGTPEGDGTLPLGDRGTPRASGAAPSDPKAYKAYAQVKIDAARTADLALALEPWWVSDQQRALREAAGVTPEQADEIKAIINDRVAQFRRR